MGIRSGAKPSTYGYPPALEEKKKKGKDGEDKMDVDEKKDDKKEKMEVDEKKEEEKKEDEKKADEPEPNFELLSNPARVMKAQLKVVSLEEGSKYRPMKDLSIGGVIMLDRAELGADEKEEIVEPILVNKAGASKEDEEEEPAPPEPFQYTED